MGQVSKVLNSENAVREWLCAWSGSNPEELTTLMEENHPVYQGLSAAAVIRIRGALLIALARNPLPENTLPFLLEELETPHNAYLTAAAAYCLRVSTFPSREFVQPLLSALAFIQYQDDIVRLSEYGGQGRGSQTTTAMTEVIRTLGWLEWRARSALGVMKEVQTKLSGTASFDELDSAIEKIESSTAPDIAPQQSTVLSTCCSNTVPENSRQVDVDTIVETQFEDQNSENFTFGEYFLGQPTIVVFFYTRCENKLKCPVTITKLGRVQRLLRKQKLEGIIRTAAITYDSEFDTPDKLEQYRRSWGAEQGPGFKMLRTIDDFEPVKSYFQLGVSYGLSTVNRHRIEIVILDAGGHIAFRGTRTQWREQDIIDRCSALLKEYKKNKAQRREAMLFKGISCRRTRIQAGESSKHIPLRIPKRRLTRHEPGILRQR